MRPQPANSKTISSPGRFPFFPTTVGRLTRATYIGVVDVHVCQTARGVSNVQHPSKLCNKRLWIRVDQHGCPMGEGFQNLEVVGIRVGTNAREPLTTRSLTQVARIPMHPNSAGVPSRRGRAPLAEAETTAIDIGSSWAHSVNAK